MTWFKIDDNFFMHPKVIAAGNSAIGLFVRAGAWSSNHLTDGFIPEPVAAMLGSDKDATDLIVAGLWVAVEGGYRIPDFLDYNPSAQAVKAEQARRSEAAKVAGVASAKARATIRQRSANDDVDESLTTSLTNRCADVATSPEPRPDPYPTRKTPPPPDNTRPVDKSVDEVVEVVAKTIMSQSPPDSPPRNIGNYLAGVRRRLKADHPDLSALVTQLGVDGAAAAIVAREITQPDLEPKPPEPQHDPDCPECAGSGWRTIDHDRNIVGPCDCEPSGHVATVTELRRTS